ncbi:MAG: hypothetical protein OEM27_04715 [Nitrospinota bacterium]|nr:hypothetical protein [Nitrospinota bacterium]
MPNFNDSNTPFFELGPDFVHAKSPDSVAAPYLIDGNPEAAAF